MTIKYSNEEYKVEHYEDIPDSADLVKDITKNIRDNILSVLAKRIENNQNLGSGMSHALHTTLSATHTEICKVLNTLNASVFGLIGESLDNYFAKKQKITLLEQWAKQYKIDVPTVWTDD